MSGLFDSLSVASTSLNAQRMGLDLVGQNMANVNTEGYSKRTIVLAERAPTDVNSAGRGVTVAEIASTRDAFIQSRLTQENPAKAMDSTVADSLSVAEAALGTAGSSLDASLQQFFSAFSALSENPSSPELRDGAARQGQALAQMFHDISDRLKTVASDADGAITGSVGEINRLTTQIGQYNSEIMTANGRDVTSLIDQRDVALQNLSKLADISAVQRSDGGMDVSIGRGRALVIGANSTTMSVTNEAATGNTLVMLGDTDISGDIHGGMIAGEMAIRDHYIPDYLNKLDTLAFDFGTAVNDLHATGTDVGAMAGLYGCAMLVWSGLLASAPWVASALTGALLAAVLVAALVLRAKGMTPAATAARLSELQARIRPHFLFNTLNSAIALVRAEPARAEALLEDLSDLFRHALADPGESVTLAQEIALAKRYLAIEQVRFGERLRISWELDPAANLARLPPLLLQPLVENAVLHGVEPSASGAQLKISTERRGDKVVIKVGNTVADEPVAQEQAKGNGMALANVRDRLSLLHDVQGHFQAGLKNGVYQVRIEVPA